MFGKTISFAGGYLDMKKDQVLGTVYTIYHSNAECYYLRLLLHEVCSPVSVTTLKNVAGVVHISGGM